MPAIVRTIKRAVRGCPVPVAAESPVGVGVPCVVIDGVTKTAANIDAGWIDFNAHEAIAAAAKRPTLVLNDADAAGLAEMRFGAGFGEKGVVLVLTLGTGVGSALFNNGVLVPNTELGHMEIRGRDAERRSAAVARTRRGLSWKAWSADLEEHLQAIDKLFSPNLIILGGGVSKQPGPVHSPADRPAADPAGATPKRRRDRRRGDGRCRDDGSRSDLAGEAPRRAYDRANRPGGVPTQDTGRCFVDQVSTGSLRAGNAHRCSAMHVDRADLAGRDRVRHSPDRSSTRRRWRGLDPPDPRHIALRATPSAAPPSLE